jgi:hypothetical protein
LSIVISQNIVLSAPLDERELNRARICVDNVFTRGVVTASSENAAENGWLENAIDGVPYDVWRPEELPAWISCELPESQDVDYVAIAVHSGVTFVAQYLDDSDDWQDLHSPVSTDKDSVHIVFFDPVSVGKVRVYFSASVESFGYVGVVAMGLSIQLPKLFYGGHEPITLNRTTQIIRNRTEEQLDAGVYHLKTGGASSVAVTNIRASWAWNNIERLNAELATRPFFFAWRPFSQPDDVAYCWLNGPITATNNGNRDLVDMQFSMNAYLGGRVLVPPPFDPCWDDVKLLLSFDQDPLIDESVGGQSTSIVLSPEQSFDIKKFGVSSGYYPGNSFTQIVKTGTNVNINQDFTFEFWVYPLTFAIESPNNERLGIVSYGSGIFFNSAIIMNTNGTAAFRNITNGVFQVSSTASMNLNDWNHVAVDRHNNQLWIYVNGIASAANAFVSAVSGPIFLGIYAPTAFSTGRLKGYLDESRITIGCARYKGQSFDPPTEPYPRIGPP